MIHTSRHTNPSCTASLYFQCSCVLAKSFHRSCAMTCHLQTGQASPPPPRCYFAMWHKLCVQLVYSCGVVLPLLYLQTGQASPPRLRCCIALCWRDTYTKCRQNIHSCTAALHFARCLMHADRPGKPTTPALLQLSAPHLPLLLKAGLSRRAHATHASFSSRGDRLVASYHGDHAYVFDITGGCWFTSIVCWLFCSICNLLFCVCCQHGWVGVAAAAADEGWPQPKGRMQHTPASAAEATSWWHHTMGTMPMCLT